MGCIPPIPDFNTGEPTCPLGYVYDPVQKLCCPTANAPVDLSNPVIQKLVLGLPDVSIDPSQAARLGMEGVKASGIIERAVVAFLRGVITLFGPLMYEAASLIDDFLVVLSNIFFYAQGQRTSGYYLLVAALMEDMLGIAVDGNKLYADFQKGGRLQSMVDLGGALFNTLAGEFGGVAQTATSGAFVTAPGQGIGGLPAITLSEQQGVDGARALMGFVTSFAVREGNTDLLADYLPYGLGLWFKDFAEDFSKGIGIGRMLRPALKPLITTMVATPMQWAMNTQYRPTLPTPREAHLMWNLGALDVPGLQKILARHGFDSAMFPALQYESMEKPSYEHLRVYGATHDPADPTQNTWLARLGYTPEVIALLQDVYDALPMRESVLAAAHQFAAQYLHGKITRTQFEGAINSIKNKLDGTPILTEGEVTNLMRLASIAGAAPRRHLSYAQLTRMYIDGLITLQEFEADLVALGYSADDVTIATQELLLMEKRAAQRAAKLAAAATPGPLAKLTVAELQSAYISGLTTLAEIQTELQARRYAQDAINALLNEFRIKNGLLPSATPTIP